MECKVHNYFTIEYVSSCTNIMHVKSSNNANVKLESQVNHCKFSCLCSLFCFPFHTTQVSSFHKVRCTVSRVRFPPLSLNVYSRQNTMSLVGITPSAPMMHLHWEEFSLILKMEPLILKNTHLVFSSKLLLWLFFRQPPLYYLNVVVHLQGCHCALEKWIHEERSLKVSYCCVFELFSNSK